MDRGIIGCLVGYFLGRYMTEVDNIELNKLVCGKRKIKDKYIPPYSGHWVNRGDWNNEDWYFKEPGYRQRYVNVVDKEEYYLISIDWIKKDGAIDYCKCNNHEDAEMEVECFILDYSIEKEVRCINTKVKCFIFTISTSTDITIKIANQMNKEYYEAYKFHDDKCGFKVLDFIKCLDEEEVLDLAHDISSYYKEYGNVEIENSLGKKE